jgi:hypothetical protein
MTLWYYPFLMKYISCKNNCFGFLGPYLLYTTRVIAEILQTAHRQMALIRPKNDDKQSCRGW